MDLSFSHAVQKRASSETCGEDKDLPAVRNRREHLRSNKKSSLAISSTARLVSIFTCALANHTGFISRNHVFDVDEGIFTSMRFEQLQSLIDELPEIHALPLAVVRLITRGLG